MKINSILSVVFFCLAFTFNSYSQKSLNDYTYVVISEQFEFQNEKDKYQLNSLTKFLFNKYGFHAFFNAEVPVNVKRCDGLWVEAEGALRVLFSQKFNLYSAIVTGMKSTELSLVKVKLKTTRRLITNL